MLSSGGCGAKKHGSWSWAFRETGSCERRETGARAGCMSAQDGVRPKSEMTLQGLRGKTDSEAARGAVCVLLFRGGRRTNAADRRRWLGLTNGASRVRKDVGCAVMAVSVPPGVQRAEAGPNVWRQGRAQRSGASPLHAGVRHRAGRDRWCLACRLRLRARRRRRCRTRVPCAWRPAIEGLRG